MEHGTRILRQAEAILTRGSEVSRRLCVSTLGRVGKDSVPALILALDPEQGDAVRALAAGALAGIGADAAPAVDALCACLHDAGVRQQAAIALGAIGEPAAAALSRELDATEDGDTRQAILFAFGRVGTGAAGAGKALHAVAKRGAPAEQPAAWVAWGRAAGKVKKAASAVTKLLRESDPTVRCQALEQLSMLGGDAARHLPEIEGQLAAPEPEVRAGAAMALARLGAEAREPGAAPALLRDADGRVRRHALLWVDAANLEGAEIDAAVATLVQDEDARVAELARVVVAKRAS